MGDQHIHTPGDGRGARAVYVDGRLMSRVTFADTRRGIVRYEAFPRRMDKHGKRWIERTRRGKVEVRALSDDR